VEDQRLAEGIEGRVDDPGGQVGDLAGAEDPEFFADPLLGAAGDDVDDLLAVRMEMEGVAVARRHRGPDHQQFLRGHQVRAAEPFVVRPRVGLADRFAVLDEALG
jgi:hypothetical protein